MTRKSRVLCQVEALEPKALLSSARAVPTLPAGIATVAVEPLIALGTNATPPPAPANTVPSPTAPVENALDGGYVQTGRSLSVNGEGIVAALGQANVSGSITVSGPRSAQNVAGTLTLAGSQGSVTMQLAASNARNVIGNKNGPVAVTETVTGATGNGVLVQGETGHGFLRLGPAKHRKIGKINVSQGSFWLFADLTMPTG
jgi:hypothetical protein